VGDIKMELKHLQVNSLNKLDSVLKEVFGTDFNFSAGNAKLTKVKAVTETKIKALRESGVEVNNKQYQKLLLVLEGINTAMKQNTIMENDLDSAEVLLAAKQMADDLQKMAENLASMQVEELMSITNAMKEEVGMAEADAFNVSAEAAISSALEAVKAANAQVADAVLVAQGQAPETDMGMDMEPAMEPELGMDEPAMDMDEPAMDDFEGADAASAETDEDGREMKEDAYLSALRLVKEAQANGMVNKQVLKQAFAALKK
jgi:hypothetical protein|tara:strand:- start:1101 stop:1880 length:780 start_codon:yes stop_codon:yes gene_type:complete